MTNLRERASRIESEDLEAMLGLAEEVRWDLDAMPNQIAAAEALKRSILVLNKSQSTTKLEVVKARFDKLVMTL